MVNITDEVSLYRKMLDFEFIYKILVDTFISVMIFFPSK